MVELITIEGFCNPVYYGEVFSRTYLTALALSPTQEKDLIDRQKAVLARWDLPSALALPPLAPLRFTSAPPSREDLRRLRGSEGRVFSFSGYRFSEGILYAGIDREEVLPGGGENSGGPALFAPFPGFYIADIGGKDPEDLDVSALPELPAPAVRTARILAFEIVIADPEGPWWRGVQWTVSEAGWIKLKP